MQAGSLHHNKIVPNRHLHGHAILARPDTLGSPVLFQWLSPLVGVAFLVVCLGAWQFGVRHYQSTES